MHIFKVLRFWHLRAKSMQNGSKKTWILRSKIEKNRCKNVLEIHVFLDITFLGIWAGFGTGFERFWEAMEAHRLSFNRHLIDIVKR